jgi:hypothetical protein
VWGKVPERRRRGVEMRKKGEKEIDKSLWTLH